MLITILTIWLTVIVMMSTNKITLAKANRWRDVLFILLLLQFTVQNLVRITIPYDKI